MSALTVPSATPSGSRDIAVVFVEQFGTAQQRESQLEARRVQCTEAFLPDFSGASLTDDVDEQALRFQICISGGVDEGHPELTAVFRDFPRDIRRDEQWRFARGLAPPFEYCRRHKSVDCLDFGTETVR